MHKYLFHTEHWSRNAINATVLNRVHSDPTFNKMSEFLVWMLTEGTVELMYSEKLFFFLNDVKILWAEAWNLSRWKKKEEKQSKYIKMESGK